MTTNQDWRDPAKERDPEDDEIGTGGWHRKADGTWEKVPTKPEKTQVEDKETGSGDDDQT